MNEHHPLIEAEARQIIRERVVAAAAPRMPRTHRRHRVARRLRSVADRLDG